MRINKTKYIINEENYYNIETQKTKIILTDTGRKSNYGLIHLLNKYDGKHKEYPHFTVTRDGYVYQHFDSKYYSEFFNDMTLNKTTIIISLENMGGLYYVQSNNKYYNKLNESCEEENILSTDWRNFFYFEKYPEIQQKTTIELCIKLCDKHKIVKDTYGHNVYDEDARFYNGIICRSNLDHKFLDLNPSFNFKTLIKNIT